MIRKRIPRINNMITKNDRSKFVPLINYTAVRIPVPVVRYCYNVGYEK